jgi:hypothetical protein
MVQQRKLSMVASNHLPQSVAPACALFAFAKQKLF